MTLSMRAGNELIESGERRLSVSWIETLRAFSVDSSPLGGDSLRRR